MGLRSSGVKSFMYEMPIERVKRESFNSNEQIEEVSIKDAKAIDDGTFEGCVSLTSLTLPGIEAYSANIFGSSKPQNLQVVKILDGTKSIGTLLSGLQNLVEASLPDSIESLDSGALDGCKSLVQLNISPDCTYADN